MTHSEPHTSAQCTALTQHTRPARQARLDEAKRERARAEVDRTIQRDVAARLGWSAPAAVEAEVSEPPRPQTAEQYRKMLREYAGSGGE